MFVFVSWQSDHFWLRYSKSHIWPWQVKVMAKVKPDGHIWGREFNRYVCFSLHGNRITFGLRYSKFNIWPWKLKVKVTTKMDQNLIRWSIGQGQQSCHNWKKSQKVVQKLSREQDCGLRWRRRGKRTGTKTKSSPVYWGDLIITYC